MPALTRNRVAGALTGVAAIAASLLIKPSEGEMLTAYLDEPRVPSICFGHTLGVHMGDRATPAQCDALLAKDLGAKEADLDRLIKVKLSDNRKAAWLSFVFNVGAGNLATSTALRKINSGDELGACREMSKWVCVHTAPGTGDASGQCHTGRLDARVSKGLAERRQREMEVCLRG